MVIGNNSLVSVCFNKETSDLMFRCGTKVFTQRLQDVDSQKLFPAVSVKNAKIRIFKDEMEIME